MQGPIRVEAPDLRSAFNLIDQAREAYETDLVPRPDDAWEVLVAARGERGRLVTDVLELVERWLDRAGVPTTTVHLDGHAYTMNRRPATVV